MVIVYKPQSVLGPSVAIIFPARCRLSSCGLFDPSVDGTAGELPPAHPINRSITKRDVDMDDKNAEDRITNILLTVDRAKMSY